MIFVLITHMSASMHKNVQLVLYAVKVRTVSGRLTNIAVKNHFN